MKRVTFIIKSMFSLIRFFSPFNFFIFFLLVSVLPNARADIYVFKVANGVMRFTNVPNEPVYRRITRNRPKHVSLHPTTFRCYKQIVGIAADKYGVDESLVWAVMKLESDSDPWAVSWKGASGLIQLVPATANQHNMRNIHDPKQNVDGGVRYLRLLLDRFKGNLRLSHSAYNAGIKAVEKYKNTPPFKETQDYVRRVLAYRQTFGKNGTLVLKGQGRRK